MHGGTRIIAAIGDDVSNGKSDSDDSGRRSCGGSSNSSSDATSEQSFRKTHLGDSISSILYSQLSSTHPILQAWIAVRLLQYF